MMSWLIDVPKQLTDSIEIKSKPDIDTDKKDFYFQT